MPPVAPGGGDEQPAVGIVLQLSETGTNILSLGVVAQLLANGGDVGKVLASNKSATPLVALAREKSRVEKRDVRLRKLRNQAWDIQNRIEVLEAEINDELVAATEVA